MTVRQIQLRGVRVNNLKDVDLDIPHGQLVAICGLSGSGKTSLALDTLFAEGQRRYIECFSAYTRQFLDQLEKPDADQIEGIPPAIAVTASRRGGTNRTTVGTVTESIDYLRLLFSKIATAVCPNCATEVQQHSPQSVARSLLNENQQRRFQICFPLRSESLDDQRELIGDLARNGFRRAISDHATVELDQVDLAARLDPKLLIVVDRLKTGRFEESRCIESLETAFHFGHGAAIVLLETDVAEADQLNRVDGIPFEQRVFNTRLVCGGCFAEFPTPEPTLFSFNSPRGACQRCEGFGSVHKLDMQKIVPDDSKTIAQGAIAPWNTPAYEHELQELTELAEAYEFPLHTPFRDLQQKHIELLWKGVAERDFGGLNGFFNWLERRKYKMHLRVFLSRWRSFERCPDCLGKRLNEMALAYQVGGRNIYQWATMSIAEMIAELSQQLELDPGQLEISENILRLVRQRLEYLVDVGVGYLTLDRTMNTLSAGESQRVALTRALGSTLVNLLYVLDEPSSGLHPHDIQRIKSQIFRLCDRNNTVVMVDHDPEIIRAAHRVLEIGPAAGAAGGEIVFDGSAEQLVADPESLTGQFLAGTRGFVYSSQRRPSNRGRIKLTGASGNNLTDLTVEFPANLLCVVTGVSGSGKSSLVRQTLGRAMQKEFGENTQPPLAYKSLSGIGKFDNVVVIDQSSLMRTSRSNPVTYVKAFDEVRKVFASTVDAKTRNFKPGHFSFNVDGGRCDHCSGEGYLTIDMQFMADVLKRCDQCQGTRFKSEVREVRYRGKNIAEVLAMSVGRAIGFFRGHKKVQAKLMLLKEVGLDYLQLGQPASTLSAGEAQRLKLASYLGAASSKQTLFLMDEPTSGLHMADVLKLVDCFDSLIDVGHSMIVIEQNLQMMMHADFIIDLGPGAADQGGQIVATGTPEEICDNSQSLTGRYLKQKFADILE